MRISARAMCTRLRQRCARPSAASPCHRHRARCAASRSPLVQMRVPGALRPLRARDGRPPTRVRAPGGRISRYPATSPIARASPARCTAIEPGRRRNSTSSTTIRLSLLRIGCLKVICSSISSAVFKPPFGVPQAGLNAFELAALQ
jgi:hypothetical protein